MRPRVWRWSAVVCTGLWAGLAVGDQSWAQSSNAPVSSLSTLESAVVRALALNPETAPYPIRTSLAEGRLRLSGVVGTKHAHDSAIRTVMAFTPNIDDQIVIDTAATIPAAAGAGMAGMSAGHPYPVRPTMGTRPYTYPPPLFGYYDDPFYGFEPPVISYPPWWNAMSAVRLAPRRDLVPPMAAPVPEAAPQPSEPASPPPEPEPASPAENSDSFEMTIDPQGIATLKGKAKNPAERAEIERRIARMPGVAGVVNELEVETETPEDEAPAPPKPKPRIPRLLDPRSAAPAAREDDSLAGRVRSAIRKRPGLEGSSIRVEDRNGSVALSGQVPDLYEAMMAFRAAQQTPGVKSVTDRLDFDVPRPGEPNPLVEKGASEDVEPYLKAQIQRQVGESVHIDRVSAQGEDLEVRGTLSDEGDQTRVEAVLRSMPILRGYRVRPVFRLN